MPKYYFYTAAGPRAMKLGGIELPDVNAARKEAVRFAGEVLAEDQSALWDGQDYRVEVTDEDDKLVVTIVVVAVGPRASARDSLQQSRRIEN